MGCVNEKQPSKSKMNPKNKLHVVTSFFQPVASPKRVELYKKFADQMAEYQNIYFWTIECAFPGQQFAVTNPKNQLHFQVRTKNRIWLKQNLLNLLMRQLPKSAQYVAWIDADVEFMNYSWVEETLDKLEKVDVLQLFEDAELLSQEGAEVHTTKSLLYYAVKQPGQLENVLKHPYSRPVAGYAWAMHMSYFNRIIKLFDENIACSNDEIIGYSIIGRLEDALEKQHKLHEEFTHSINEWAIAAIAENGYDFVSGKIKHHYHGPHASKKDRYSLLEKYQYNPRTDLTYNHYGIMELVETKKGFESELLDLMNGKVAYLNENQNNNEQAEIILVEDEIGSELN